MSSPYDGFKPAQTGLVDMGNISFYNTGATPIFNLAEVEPYGSSFSELVLNVTWAQLQPTANGPVVTSAIDSAIAQVEASRRLAARHVQAPQMHATVVACHG